MTQLVAVVDLGSTAVRFRLARITPRAGYRVLVQERVETRLGDGAPGTLSREAIRKTLRAVHQFLAHHASNRVPRIVAVATSAVRDARNRERLLAPLRCDGIEVRVLSARAEARLGVSAAVASLSFENGVVADLGGSSLQLSRVRRGKVLSVASLPLGAVRATRQYFRHDPPTPRELRAFRNRIRAEMGGVMPPAGRGEVMIGLGGTVRSLAGIHLRAHRERRRRHGLSLHQSDVTAIRERLEGVSRRKRPMLRGLKRERADIILAGAIVLEEAMVFGGYLRLVVCTRGVGDGILLRETFNGRRAR